MTFCWHWRWLSRQTRPLTTVIGWAPRWAVPLWVTVFMQCCLNMLGLEDQLSLLDEAKVWTKSAWMTSRSNQEARTRGSSLQHHRGSTPRVSLYPEYLLSNALILSTMGHCIWTNSCLSSRSSTKPFVTLHLVSQSSFTCLPKRTCHYLTAVLLALSKGFLEGDIYFVNSYFRLYQ